MNQPLHITSGDCAGGALAKSGLPGEVFVWHDILYDGPRLPGWPDDHILLARTEFLERATGGGLQRDMILTTLRAQYQTLAEAAAASRGIVLWFDPCLFDQSMLAHVLACLQLKGAGPHNVELLCVDAFPGIVPFDGLGQLQPAQLAPLYAQRRPVTAAQFAYAAEVDAAFATQDQPRFAALAAAAEAPLPWMPAAVMRWLQERPAPDTGLGRLEQLALTAIRQGCETPAQVFKAASAADTHPQFWGDTTLWAKINALADRTPPLVTITGPTPRLPLWTGQADLTLFGLAPTPSG